MSVRAPGQQRIGVMKGRGLRSLAARGVGRRGAGGGVSMTSMIDVMVVLTVFLLLSFQPPDACACTTRRPAIPSIEHGVEMIDAPLVTVVGDLIYVDGLPIQTGELRPGAVQRIDALYNLLKGKREVAKLVAGSRPPPTAILLSIDVDVPSGLVKSVFQTAALSGYSDVSFVGELRPR